MLGLRNEFVDRFFNEILKKKDTKTGRSLPPPSNQAKVKWEQINYVNVRKVHTLTNQKLTLTCYVLLNCTEHCDRDLNWQRCRVLFFRNRCVMTRSNFRLWLDPPFILLYVPTYLCAWAGVRACVCVSVCVCVPLCACVGVCERERTPSGCSRNRNCMGWQFLCFLFLVCLSSPFDRGKACKKAKQYQLK